MTHRLRFPARHLILRVLEGHLLEEGGDAVELKATAAEDFEYGGFQALGETRHLDEGCGAKVEDPGGVGEREVLVVVEIDRPLDHGGGGRETKEAPTGHLLTLEHAPDVELVDGGAEDRGFAEAVGEVPRAGGQHVAEVARGLKVRKVRNVLEDLEREGCGEGVGDEGEDVDIHVSESCLRWDGELGGTGV